MQPRTTPKDDAEAQDEHADWADTYQRAVGLLETAIDAGLAMGSRKWIAEIVEVCEGWFDLACDLQWRYAEPGEEAGFG